MRTATASAPAGRKNAITGIYVDKINRDLILKSLKELSIEHDLSSTTEHLSVALHMHFASQPQESLFRCDACGGISNEELDSCPYCGHDSGTPLVDKPQQQAPASVQQQTTQEAQPMGNNASTATNGHASNGAKMVKVNGKGKGEPKSSATEAELDQSVHKIQQYKSEGSVALWKVGREVAHVYDNQLWKLRVTKDDKDKERPRWASFEAFCNEEIGMTPQNARMLMDVAKNFNEDDVKAFGTTKLGLILQAPPKDREELKEKVRRGASKREVQREVVERKKKSGYVRKSRSGGNQSKGVKAASKASTKSRSVGTITVAKILGSSVVKLYEKPPSMKGLDAESIKKLPRAKKIGDGAIGCIELSNEVTEWLNVFQTPGGELAVKIQRVRDEE